MNNLNSSPRKLSIFPSQIKYIVWNEACERYSYYGMRSILVIFLVSYLGLEKFEATSDYHLFAGACYLFPLLGAYISDRFWGKYKTILYLSIVYCLGHLFLAIFENNLTGFYIGLGLIALGSGGIKPCVSAHVGDQFKPSQKASLQKVFDLFYFMINFGSTFSTMITPWTLKAYGPGIAFGIPGILMAIATFIFWLGRNEYVHIPPTGANPHGTGRVLLSALKNFQFSKGILSGAYAEHPKQAVDDVKAAFEVGKIFIAITIFWALFDQHGSSWVLQAKEMNLVVDIFGHQTTLLPSQIPALNPIMVMVLIPFFTFGIYPLLEKIFKTEMSPLKRMGSGMFVAAFSFVFVAIYQYMLDDGNQISVLWQIIPFLVITMAEVMISITGLQFAYTQAPRSMKSTIMSMWLLTVFFGNMITAYIAKINIFEGGHFFMFFAILMGVFAIFFVWIARNYQMKDYMEK
ncbi:MAG: MFS transporter [Halobacteriovoraceae bacterium]|nr:MFS transporter [Halobacteriovoraceae bacterium]|tara:strand:- start:1176 stop:2558 length:1383 start_codon:yes stop_codon:yes gene_type:complete